MKSLPVLTAACTGVLALTSGGAAQETVTARLTAKLPLRASPATTVRVQWTVDGGKTVQSKRMFVRLLSRTGASPTIGFARPATARGRYSAGLKVPAGRIGGIRLGFARPSGISVELENDPFRTPGGAQCDAAALGTTLTAFARAYNRGDVRQLDRLFSRKRFRWYASTGAGIREPPESLKRETLVGYFRERHRRGDRLLLERYRFNSYERARNLGHFGLDGQRRANDFQAGRWVRMTGKGALDCSTEPPTISVMLVGAAVS